MLESCLSNQNPIQMPEFVQPALPRRLAALLYDTCLVLPIIMVTVALVTGLQVLMTGDSGNSDYSTTLPAWFVQLITVLTVVGFYSFFWRRGGQSLGMRAWRIKLRNTATGDISTRQVLLRCFGALLSALPAGLGYLWCLVDKRGLYWHDRLSNTELELLPKEKKTKATVSS